MYLAIFVNWFVLPFFVAEIVGMGAFQYWRFAHNPRSILIDFLSPRRSLSRPHSPCPDKYRRHANHRYLSNLFPNGRQPLHRLWNRRKNGRIGDRHGNFSKQQSKSNYGKRQCAGIRYSWRTIGTVAQPWNGLQRHYSGIDICNVKSYRTRPSRDQFDTVNRYSGWLCCRI